MTTSKPSIGLIAGYGSFPLELAAILRDAGYAIHAVAVREETSREIESLVDSVVWLRVGELGGMLKAFKKAGITEVVMAGKVRKLHLFRNFRPDFIALKELLSLPDRKDDTLMLGVTNFLAKSGITVLSQVERAGDMLAGAGLLFGPKLKKKDFDDVRFGFKQAKGVAALDIGQTIVVQDTAVLAVEAIEGTDQAIRRGGELGSGKAMVIKVAKPDQDLRFDVPAIGPDTLEVMHQSGCSAIVIEAGATLLLERHKIAPLAEKYGISVYGASPQEIGID